MPDFLSRLVERTFGLMPVAQPVLNSIFAPMPAVESDYIPDLARDNESVSNPDSFQIDSAQGRITPQHGNPPATNLEKPSNNISDNQPVPVQNIDAGSPDKAEAKHRYQMDDRDSRSAFTSVQRPLRQEEPLRQNDSNSQEQVGHVPSRHVSDQDNQYVHTPPAKLVQDKEPLYPVDSDNSGTARSGPLYVNNRNDRSTLPSIPKPAHHEEPFHGSGPDSPGHVELGQKDVGNIGESRNIFMSALKPAYDKEQPQSPETNSLEHARSEPSYPAGLQKNQNIFTSEPELPYEDLSASKHSGESTSGQNGQSVGGSVDKTLMERIPESRLSQPAGLQKNRKIFTSEPDLPVSKRSGESTSGQNEPFIDSVDSSVDKTLLEHVSNSSLSPESSSSPQTGEPASREDSYPLIPLRPDARSTPIIASGQNSKRVNDPKVNAALEQMGNMLIDRHAVAPGLPSTAPTIRVTIGRIEVRAVTPPPAPQPQTPRTKQYPILSLDDYLKQYNG